MKLKAHTSACHERKAAMKKMLYKIWSKFLAAFGNVKCFRWPLFLIYDPDDFEVSGPKVAQICKIL